MKKTNNCPTGPGATGPPGGGGLCGLQTQPIGEGVGPEWSAALWATRSFGGGGTSPPKQASPNPVVLAKRVQAQALP
jgi:hypothetical protein